ncbi:MAG: hypothetical protein OJF49_003449 [Ktedonobacterales bacterium]|nr:MAG: hypothetical protein OJF49_003449 [Ktedonobacterales bacterium]
MHTTTARETPEHTTYHAATSHLLAELHAHGLHYLINAELRDDSGKNDEQQPLTPGALLTQLAQSPDPRVRDSIIGLLFLHPRFAVATADVRTTAPDQAKEQVMTLLLAALYLQRIWRLPLTLALGHAPRIPERRFAADWRVRGLPAPVVAYGEAGLQALAAYERQRTGVLANYVADWQNQLDHVLAQEGQCREWRPSQMLPRASQRFIWTTAASQRTIQRTSRHAHAVSPRATTGKMAADVRAGTAEEHSMSLRPDVTHSDIERFLQELGRRVRHAAGRIYLAGGAELIHSQVRGQGASTADIDLKLAVSDEQEVEDAIRQLKIQLGINVELAAPGAFIPLPASWETMSRYVGRYGTLDVFYFDFYSPALAKIARGSSRDLADVALLHQQGYLDRAVLDAAYHEIAPQLGHGRFFNLDPVRIAQQYAAVVRQLWGASS